MRVRGVVLLLVVVGVVDDNVCSDGKGYSYPLGAPLYSSIRSLEIKVTFVLSVCGATISSIIDYGSLSTVSVEGYHRNI